MSTNYNPAPFPDDLPFPDDEEQDLYDPRNDPNQQAMNIGPDSYPEDHGQDFQDPSVHQPQYFQQPRQSQQQPQAARPQPAPPQAPPEPRTQRPEPPYEPEPAHRPQPQPEAYPERQAPAQRPQPPVRQQAQNGGQNQPAQHLTGYAALDEMNPSQLARLIEENLPDDGISFRDLAKITVPSQGRVTWTFETAGEEVSTRSLEGIILHTMIHRAFWQKSPEDSGGSAPPDCASTDGQTGIGNPGGSCRTCPLNVFPPNGGGKPCRESRIIFLLQPHKKMPSVVQAPPTSIPQIRKYLTQLTTEEFLPQWAVETSLTLTRVEGKNFPYSLINLNVRQRLPQATIGKLQEYVHYIKPFLTQAVQNQEFRPEEYLEDPSGENHALPPHQG